MQDMIVLKNSHIIGSYLYKPWPLPVKESRRKMSMLASIRSGLTNTVRNCNSHFVTKISGQHIWAIADWSNNYYHWLYDTIPRLLTA